MAQTKRKRTRKHRGTPAGTIERAGRTGRPGGTQKDGKQIARQRREERMSKPPTWRGAINRAAIAAAVFGVLVWILKKDVAQAAGLAAVMVLIYIPLGYTTDLGIYRFRQRRRAAARK